MPKLTQQADAPTVAVEMADLAHFPAEPDSTGTSHEPGQAGTDSEGHDQSTPRDNVATTTAGRKVGKYLILGELGAGGMGVVYRAVNPDLQCIVALKMIRSGAMARPKEIHRFLQESAALARVKHPNIVPVHDADEFEGQPYFVMEYLGGGSLSKHRARYQEDQRLAVALIAKLARAVHQLHQLNMVHRDLKPANVLLDESGEPYITDFGLVKLLDTSDNLTRSKQGLGTPSYMAPEQTGLVKLRPGPQSDIWALGVMLYELLAGQRPFAAEDQTELYRQIIHDDPARPSASKTGFDPGLEAVIFKCLEKALTDRFASALDLADELDRWLAGEPLKTKPPTRPQRLMRWARKHPALVAVAATFLLFALITPVVLYLRDPERILEAHHQKLVRGEKVILVPEKGMPRYSRPWRKDTGAEMIGPDGYFAINAWGEHFVEFLDELPKGAFRLTAKIRHEKTDIVMGWVGIYVSSRAKKLSEGRGRHLFLLTFNDVRDQSLDIRVPVKLQPDRLPNLADLHLRSWLEATPKDLHGKYLLRSTRFTPAGGDPCWRILTIDVYPDHIVADFDNREPMHVAFEQASDHIRQTLLQIDRIDPRSHKLLGEAFPVEDMNGSLGVYVDDGFASISEFAIEPLPLTLEKE